VARMPDPSQVAPPAPLRSLEDAQATLGALGRVRASLREYDQALDQTLENARAAHALICVDLVDRQTELETQLVAFLEKPVHKGQTFELDTGRIGWKATKPAVELPKGVKESDVVAKLTKVGGVFLKVVALLKKIPYLGATLGDVLAFNGRLNKDGIHRAVKAGDLDLSRIKRAGILYRLPGQAPFLEPFEPPAQGPGSRDQGSGNEPALEDEDVGADRPEDPAGVY
jgi:hypothetical protein